MRRQTPVAHLVYSHLYPYPTAHDPVSFTAHLARNLVPEVRIEVATFYGNLNSAEARYPGLDYCHPPHRMRLSRFKHHRRLFDVFDYLGLTYAEVQDLCCWEGTKWARERYEKDEGVKVADTTGNEIGWYVDRRESRAVDDTRRGSITRKTDISVIVEDAITALRSRQPYPTPPQDQEMSDEGYSDGESEDGDDHDMSAETIATQEHLTELVRRRDQAINQRLMTAWEQGQRFPADIEQYLKEQSERGALGMSNDLRAVLHRRTSNSYAPITGPASSNTSTSRASRAAA